MASEQNNLGDEEAIATLEQQLNLLARRSRLNQHRLAREIHREIDPAAYDLLTSLQKVGPSRLTELAAIMGTGKPTISRKVAELEELGIIRRIADPDDGRAQHIWLTRPGIVALQKAQDARRTLFHDVMADWNLEDLNTFVSLLTKLNDTYLAEQ